MKRIMILLLVLGLIGGTLASPAVAKKKKKKALVATEQSLYLRRDACDMEDSANDNPHLSIEDGEDTECPYVDRGVFSQVYEESDLVDPWEAYPSTDGVPFTLDATRAITGEIHLYGMNCLNADACAPQGGLAAGRATVKVRFFGETGGEEVALGEYEDTFDVTPAAPDHTVAVMVEPDPSLNKKVFTSFRVELFFGGNAIGPGGVSYDDPASTVVVPTWSRTK